MNSNKNLVFLGMMGSGKSSIGAMVSKKLNIPFIDIDNLIEEHAGMTISEIFKVNGEAYFRNLEEKITIKSLKNKKVVVSLGGGSFINDKIRKDILKNHFSFWLDWDDVVLIKDLPLRGTSRVYKRGTKVTGIKLTGNADEVDCKIAGSSIVLRTEFLKKL